MKGSSQNVSPGAKGVQRLKISDQLNEWSAINSVTSDGVIEADSCSPGINTQWPGRAMYPSTPERSEQDPNATTSKSFQSNIVPDEEYETQYLSRISAKG